MEDLGSSRSGVGVDLCRIDRFSYENPLAVGLRLRVFTDEERLYAQRKARPEQHFAARFAAKEAMVKALGDLGFDAPPLHEISVFHDHSVPRIRLPSALHDRVKVSLSMSHEGDYAVAFVVATRV
jgi:holo-[acyl-carrier protein] synthase